MKRREGAFRSALQRGQRLVGRSETPTPVCARQATPGAGYYRLGYAPEEIREFLTSLTLPQIYAALAHALANPEETEQSLRDEATTMEQLASESPAA